MLASWWLSTQDRRQATRWHGHVFASAKARHDWLNRGGANRMFRSLIGASARARGRRRDRDAPPLVLHHHVRTETTAARPIRARMKSLSASLRTHSVSHLLHEISSTGPRWQRQENVDHGCVSAVVHPLNPGSAICDAPWPGTYWLVPTHHFTRSRRLPFQRRLCAI